MAPQPSSRFMRITGRPALDPDPGMPAPPAIPKASRLLRSARKDAPLRADPFVGVGAAGRDCHRQVGPAQCDAPAPFSRFRPRERATVEKAGFRLTNKTRGD
jgi:hypothetical protein